MYAGLPVAYTTFLAYDEVAHHSGIERPDALSTLRQVDRQIGRIAAARRYAPRPYRLVVLSDHGQSQGATFLERYGDLARGGRARGRERRRSRPPPRPRRGARLPRRLADRGLGGRLADGRRGAAHRAGRTVDGAVQLGEGRRHADGDGTSCPRSW